MKIPSQPLDPASIALPSPPNGPGRTASGTGLGVGLTQGGTGTGPATAGANVDGATLGSSSVALTAQAMNQSDLRPNLVEQYRSQIAAGTYQVSSSQVADAMLSDPLTGLDRQGRG